MFLNMAFKGIKLKGRSGNDDIVEFEKLFRKYYAGLVNFSFSFIKDIDASEEIVQDFFYNYWKNRKEINIRFSVKSYLYRAIKNNSLKYLEAQAVRRKYADKVKDISKDHSGHENSELEYTELNRLIEKTLEDLPERCSQIFRMSRFDGLKYTEIAKELSISVKTVESNIGKALKLLRKRLGEYFKSDML